MKSVRNWHYDAVIGIGGINPDPGDEDIARRVNWIGIGPEKDHTKNPSRPMVKFSQFVLFDEKGPLISECAPKLYKYMFEQGHIPRTGKYFPEHIYQELLKLLTLAENASPSKGRFSEYKSVRKCRPKKAANKSNCKRTCR